MISYLDEDARRIQRILCGPDPAARARRRRLERWLWAAVAVAALIAWRVM